MSNAFARRTAGVLWVLALAAAPLDAQRQEFTLENLKTPSSPA